MRSQRKRLGAVAAIVAAVGLTVGVSAVPSSAGPGTDFDDVVINGSTPTVGTDCPDNVNEYWHFVIAPNNGDYEFVSITVHQGLNQQTFTGTELIPNGTQTDNIFVLVPDPPFDVTLPIPDSTADIHSDVTTEPPENWNLSHICDPTPPPPPPPPPAPVIVTEVTFTG